MNARGNPGTDAEVEEKPSRFKTRHTRVWNMNISVDNGRRRCDLCLSTDARLYVGVMVNGKVEKAFVPYAECDQPAWSNDALDGLARRMTSLMRENGVE